jgi:uncharacterized protein
MILQPSSTPNLRQLDSPVLITGAAGGLGKAFAVECAGRGWDLLLTDLKQSSLATLASSLQATYGVCVAYQACDLTDSASRDALYNRIRLEGCRLCMLINVAGTDQEGLFLEIPARRVEAIVRLNVEATLDLIHNLFPCRDPQIPFRIINVASLAAFYPMPYKATYAATKRFLLDFSLALREEVRDAGASVTALCPAGLPTTPETVQGIDAQGIGGFITTQNIGSVAAETVDAALRGKAIFIPGRLNQWLHMLSGLLPATLLAHIVSSRWRSAQEHTLSNSKDKSPVSNQPAPLIKSYG